MIPLVFPPGAKLFRVPSAIVVKRTWRERLFSRPWRPRRTTKTVPNPSCPHDGEIVHFQGSFYANAATYNRVVVELAAPRSAGGGTNGPPVIH